jgi:hypothetical protein
MATDEDSFSKPYQNSLVIALFNDAIKTNSPQLYKDIQTGKLTAQRNAHRERLNRTLNTMHNNPLFYTPDHLLNSTIQHNVNIHPAWNEHTYRGSTLKNIFRNKRSNRNKNSKSLNNNNRGNNKNNKTTRRQHRNRMLNM